MTLSLWQVLLPIPLIYPPHPQVRLSLFILWSFLLSHPTFFYPIYTFCLLYVFFFLLFLPLWLAYLLHIYYNNSLKKKDSTLCTYPSVSNTFYNLLWFSTRPFHSFLHAIHLSISFHSFFCPFRSSFCLLHRFFAHPFCICLFETFFSSSYYTFICFVNFCLNRSSFSSSSAAAVKATCLFLIHRLLRCVLRHFLYIYLPL